MDENPIYPTCQGYNLLSKWDEPPSIYIYIHYIIKKEGHDRDILLLYNAVNRDILNVYDHKYTRLAINIHSFPKHARDIWESS